MAEFVAFDKNVEVNGQTILSVISGMKGFETSARSILSNNGIVDPVPDKWYSQQAWLEAFKEIANKIGSKTLFRIGKMIPENADWPPDVNSIEKALASVDIAYHMNHRISNAVMFNPNTGVMLEGIGNYKYDKTGENQITITSHNPYPCDFDKGIIKSAAIRFVPFGYEIIFKENIAQGCRKRGHEECYYIVNWEKKKHLSEKKF